MGMAQVLSSYAYERMELEIDSSFIIANLCIGKCICSQVADQVDERLQPPF